MLGREQRAVAEVERDVLPELGEPVGVHGGRLRPRRDDDEVAIPRLDCLEPGEQLVTLGATLGAADALLRLARREIDAVERLLLPLARLLARCARGVEEDAGREIGLEPRIRVDRARRAR